MRAAIDQQHQQHPADSKEITVKTSRGEEFKFGGISEKFTRKLYEWEEQRGIAPELSTIALLNHNSSNNNNNNDNGEEHLQRGNRGTEEKKKKKKAKKKQGEVKGETPITDQSFP